MKTLLFVFLGLISFSVPAYGIPSFPEFHSLTEEEESSFDNPSRFEPEYQSDILTYSVPFQWNYDFWANPQSFLTSVGSTSENEFGISTQVKLQKWITDSLEFRWIFSDERNRDDQSVHAIMELIAWPMANKRFGISLYGEPGYHKRTNDVGLALIFKSNAIHELRFFRTFVDITRPQRNDRNDTFDGEHLPLVHGVVGRFWAPLESNESEFFQYALVYESPTEWIFPDDDYQYFYNKYFAQLQGRIKSQVSYWNFHNQFDKKWEAREKLSPSSVMTDNSVLSYRWESRVEWETLLSTGCLDRIRPGIQWVYREWHGVSDLQAKQSELLPYFWVRVPAWIRGSHQDFWEVGYELAWFRSEGDVELKSNVDLDGRVEQRLNLSYDFVFGRDSQLRILGSADLDKLFSDFNGLFEGGLAQFRMAF